MERRDFLKLLGGISAGALTSRLAFGRDRLAAKKPDFVFILIDDMGWADAGCYGSSFYETPNIDKLAGEGWLYEGGIREPMIVKWQGVVKPGSICSEPVTSTDFYPTILQMANLPLRPEQHLDGISIVPLLKQTGSLNRKALYWHYPHYSPQGSYPVGAVRVGDYKLIEFYEDNHMELYNLKDDISERNNLSSKMPQKAAKLQKMLQDWRYSVDARMPALNPDYNPRKEAKAKGGYK